MKYLLITLVCFSFNLRAQIYYTPDNSGEYCLTSNSAEINGIQVEGYWTDSVFNAGRIQYIFTDQGVTKLTKLFLQGNLYKGCSITDDLLDSTEEGSVKYPYWSITQEYYGKGKSDYNYFLLGFNDFECEPIIRVLVSNILYNTTNKTIRGEQNGKEFYLWNLITNDELTTR